MKWAGCREFRKSTLLVIAKEEQSRKVFLLPEHVADVVSHADTATRSFLFSGGCAIKTSNDTQPHYQVDIHTLVLDSFVACNLHHATWIHTTQSSAPGKHHRPCVPMVAILSAHLSLPWPMCIIPNAYDSPGLHAYANRTWLGESVYLQSQDPK